MSGSSTTLSNGRCVSHLHLQPRNHSKRRRSAFALTVIALTSLLLTIPSPSAAAPQGRYPLDPTHSHPPFSAVQPDVAPRASPEPWLDERSSQPEDDLHIDPFLPERQYENTPGRPSILQSPPPRPPQDDGGPPHPPIDPHWPLGPNLNIKTYETEPDFAPISFEVKYEHSSARSILGAHGYYMAPVTIKPSSFQIFDMPRDKFELVYLNGDKGLGQGSFNLHYVEWYGKPHLLVWSGRFMRWPGYGEGYYLLLNENYNVVWNTSLPDAVDFHDATLTPVWRKLGPFDHSRYGGSQEDGAIFDAAFAEYSPTTGKPIFGWSPYEAGLSLNLTHIKGKKTFTTLKPWDWAHTNSVSKDRLGNYLVSLRSLHTLFYIDGRTKETLWQLGGPNTNFTGRGNNFSWQHNALWLEEEEKLGAWTLDDIRVASTGGRGGPSAQARADGTLDPRAVRKRRISLYDNGALSSRTKDRNESRGLIIELDMVKMTATIISVYEHPGRKAGLLAQKDISSTSQGNLQVLPPFTPRFDAKNPHPQPFKVGQTPLLLAYGMRPLAALYARSGEPLWFTEYRAPKKKINGGVSNVDSYRSYLGPRWRGKPEWPPKIKLSEKSNAEGNTTRMAWISWNGASNVKEYRILDESTQDVVATIPRTGFESSEEIGSRIAGMPAVRLEVVDPCGNMLASSPALGVMKEEGLLQIMSAGGRWDYGWGAETDRCPFPGS
ncbi:hypothetical protein OC845_005284 [Tilletia horrida]|nr:hypothetical protein OC845_005284 [Tilletia horrida]